MKLHLRLINLSFALAGLVWLTACAENFSDGGASSRSGEPAPAPVLAPVTSSAGAGMESYQSRPADSERPGLGTGWGEKRDSRINYIPFQRASASSPYATSTLYYNDRGGVGGMADGSFYPGGASGRTFAVDSAGLVTVGLRDSSGRWWPGAVGANGRNFVIGRESARYEIILRNASAARIEAVVSVDGLDVMDGQPAAVTRGGYILGAGEELVIAGFRRSTEAVAAFRFSSVNGSYASKKGADTNNIGVIGVALFPERGSNPRRPIGFIPPWDSEARRRGGANPFPGSNGFATPP